MGRNSLQNFPPDVHEILGLNASVDELNILDGVTADKDELNILDGATLSTDELNILDGSNTKVLYVGTGCPYTTIQDAIDAAAAGDIVQLAGGTFTLNKAILTKTGVSIRGMGMYQTILKIADHRATTLTVAANNGATTITVADASQFVAGQQIAITAADYAYTSGYGTYDTATVASVSGSVITLASGIAKAGTPAYAIGAWVYPCYNAINSGVQLNGVAAVASAGASNIGFYDFQVDGNADNQLAPDGLAQLYEPVDEQGVGIKVTAGNNIRFENLYIHDTLSACIGGGQATISGVLRGSHNVVVRNCRLADARTRGALHPDRWQHAVIDGCDICVSNTKCVAADIISYGAIFMGGGNMADGASGSRDNVICNCTIHAGTNAATGGGGLSLGGNKNLKVMNCNIRDTKGHGITLPGASGVNNDNVSIVSNIIDTQVDAGYDAINIPAQAGYAQGFLIANNIMRNCKDQGLQDNGMTGGLVVVGNLVQSTNNGMSSKTPNGVFMGNHITAGNDEAIYLDSSTATNCVVIGNYLNAGNDYGLRTAASSSVLYTGNHIVSSTADQWAGIAGAYLGTGLNTQLNGSTVVPNMIFGAAGSAGDVGDTPVWIDVNIGGTVYHIPAYPT